MESNGNKTALVAGVVALVVGGVGGYAISESMTDDNSGDNASVSEDNPMTDTKAAAFRTAMNNAFTDHIAYASPALRAAFDGSPSLDGNVAALDANSVEIAEAVDSAYPGTKEDFLKLWRDHIGFFVDYTTAAKAGDEAGMKEAKDKLTGYTSDASKFFADANPNLDQATLKEGLTTHFNQVIAVVDAYGADDFEKSYSLQREASDHMEATADALSAAIVKQQPEKF